MSRLKIHFGQALLGCLAVFLAVEPGLAATPKTTYPVARIRVRVGDHRGFTRVVLDSPAPFGYSINRKSGRTLAVVLEGAVLGRPLVKGGLGRRRIIKSIAGRTWAEQPAVVIGLARPARLVVRYHFNRGSDPSRRHQLVVDLYPRAAAVKTKRTPVARKSPRPRGAGRPGPKPARAEPTAGRPGGAPVSPPDYTPLTIGTPRPAPRVKPIPVPAPVAPRPGGGPAKVAPQPKKPAAPGPAGVRSKVTPQPRTPVIPLPGSGPSRVAPQPKKPAVPQPKKPPAGSRKVPLSVPGPPPAAKAKRPAVVASLPRTRPSRPALPGRLRLPVKPPAPSRPAMPSPGPGASPLRAGRMVLALGRWKCSPTFGHWAIVYRGRLNRLDRKWAHVKLERRYGYRYRPAKKGVDRTNWWCVPRRRHCYKVVPFHSWNGRYQPGLVVRFPRAQVVAAGRRIEGGVAGILDRRCRVTRLSGQAAPAAKTKAKKTRSGRP